MHGIIFSELKKYVEAKLGAAKWPALLSAAGLPGKTYIPTQEYPDADAVALVSTASKITGSPAGTILEDFGAFIVPDLLRLYASALDASWKTLDVIEHTEATIHRVVRLRNPGASPPQLVTVRHAPGKVEIVYKSHRKMCDVAKGIARGLGEHFKETVAVTEDTCMNSGADQCRIFVTTT